MTKTIKLGTTDKIAVIRAQIRDLYEKIMIKKGIYRFENGNDILNYDSLMDISNKYNAIVSSLNKDQVLDYTKEETTIRIDIVDNDECLETSIFYKCEPIEKGRAFYTSYKVLENGDLVVKLKTEKENESLEFARRAEAGRWAIITQEIKTIYTLSENEQILLRETKKLLKL